MQKTQSTPLKSSTNKIEHQNNQRETFSSPNVKKEQAENLNGSPAPAQKKMLQQKTDSPYKGQEVLGH